MFLLCQKSNVRSNMLPQVISNSYTRTFPHKWKTDQSDRNQERWSQSIGVLIIKKHLSQF